MNIIDPPGARRRARRILPRWAGAIFCGVSMPLVHGAVPWAISLLSIRHGWVDGHPGTWNWAGLGLVALGCAGIVWALSFHFAQAPQGWEFEPTPNYLLTRGPYRFTRNPIYVAYALIWPGWVILWERGVGGDRIAGGAGRISHGNPARGTEPGSALRRNLSRVQTRSTAFARENQASEQSEPGVMSVNESVRSSLWRANWCK